MDTVKETTPGVMNRQLRELAALYHQAASRHQITNNEFWVWYSLMLQDGEHTQQSISETWSLSKQTINSVIKNMMRRHYVYLEVIPGTHNKKAIKLTEQGQEFGRNIILPIYQAEQQATARLTEEEQTMCTKVMDKYLGFLKEVF